MVEVTPSLNIDDNEIQFEFVRSSGPGGQNVNKVATSVQLRFNITNSPSLEPEVKQRLIKLAGSRATEDGVLIIEARRYRTQEQNRIDAVQKLITLVQQALIPPKTRKATRPSVTARAVRRAEKTRRSQQKRMRNYNPNEWE